MNETAARGSDWGWPSHANWRANWAETFQYRAHWGAAADSPWSSRGRLSESNSSPSEQKASSQPLAAKPRVLIVEDDAISANAMRAILVRRGFEAEVVSRVDDALIALHRRPDFMILDLMLPDGDGTQLLQYVRTNNLPTRVAVTTGVNDVDRLRLVQSLEPDGLLRKPIDLTHLLRILNIVN